MKSFVMFILFVLMFSSIAMADTESMYMSSSEIARRDNAPNELLESWYDRMCPYGDAVVTYRDAKNTKAAEVDCVVFDKSRNTWSTWSGDVSDTVLRGHITMYEFKTWNPKEYRVWVMDGELVVKDGHAVLMRNYVPQKKQR